MEEPSKEYDQGFIDGTNEGKRQFQQRIKELETVLEQHRWIPVSEGLPEKGNCLVLCEGKVYEVKVRVSEDEWEDSEGKSSLKLTAKCDIGGLGCILIGHDVCITHWKPIILPEQSPDERRLDDK